MKTALPAILALLLDVAPAIAEPTPCILTLHSAVTPQLIVINAQCEPLATQITVYRNEHPVHRITLPPPLNARPGNIVFIVATVPGVNQFSATSNDVAPEPNNDPQPQPDL